MILKRIQNKSFLFLLWLIFLSVSAWWSSPVWCDELKIDKINDIIENANDIDGQKVTIQGEVIGDVMARKDHVWFNIQDESGAMGVWATGQLAEQILVTGEYSYHGDWVEVAGTFSKADKELNGEVCVRAEMVDVLRRGHLVDHKVNSAEVNVALILSVLAAALLLLRMVIERR